MDQKGSIGKSILDRLEGSCGGLCPAEWCCAFGSRLQEVMQRLQGLGTARHKMVINVTRPTNSLNLHCVRGRGKSRMGCTLSSIGQMPWLSTWKPRKLSEVGPRTHLLWLAIKRPSKYEYRKGRPQRKWSINHWKDWAAFLKPRASVGSQKVQRVWQWRS